MGIGKRISRIIKSNVNDLLSAAENPEKQIDLLINEMEDGLRQAKQQLIEQLASEKRLQRQLDEADELTKLWEGRAQQALESGKEELAREALRKKKSYAELATEYDKQLYDQQQAMDDLRGQYKELERKLVEYRSRRGELVQRVRRQRAEERNDPTTSGRVPRGGLALDRSAFDKFEEMADKVESFEAETAAQRELEDFLQPDEELARKIDEETGRGRGGRARSDEDLKIDIELEEMRKRVKPKSEGGDGPPERLSRRAERRPEPEAEAAPEKPKDSEGDQGPDDDGWGRRVEL